MTTLDDQWAVTLFSFTRELMRGDVSATQLLVNLRESNVARSFEIDGFQHFATLPDVASWEAAAFRQAVDEHDIELTQFGVYDDLFIDPRSAADMRSRVEYIVRQIDSASRLGFTTVKITWGLELAILERLLPHLDRLGMRLNQEAQGPIRATSPDLARRVELALRFPDQFGFVFDLSACMYGLPVTYLEDLRRLGVAEEAVRLLEEGWPLGGDSIRSEAFAAAGPMSPDAKLRLSMPFSRFGNSNVREFRDFLALVDVVHLKFWDLEDEAGIITSPIRDLARELQRAGFAGPITSEWGGHEWLPAAETNGETMTLAHREVFRSAIRE
ncbi:hypothetical protein ACEYYH_01460 [Microbacterium trichothecenolyticum]|uniref:hypothetical protein n=1 Tax=Microbacterium trichothecenolyticum TaxID=69370 RepID=UPI0035BE28CE